MSSMDASVFIIFLMMYSKGYLVFNFLSMVVTATAKPKKTCRSRFVPPFDEAVLINAQLEKKLRIMFPADSKELVEDVTIPLTLQTFESGNI